MQLSCCKVYFNIADIDDMMMTMMTSILVECFIILCFAFSYSSLAEFSLIEDEKFDFLIPDEYLDESVDGTCSSNRHKDCRIGGIMACSSPIHQTSCLKQSLYDNALLQLRYRGRADLVLNQQQQHKERGEEEEKGEVEGEVGALHGSAAVDAPEGIEADFNSQADSLHEEADALDSPSSFAKEDNSHYSVSQADNSPDVVLIDLGVSPSPPPPQLNNTVTLDVSTEVGPEGEGPCWARNATFTLNECPIEGSTSAAVQDTISGSSCASEEEGQKPTRLPTLAKRTQTDLVNANVVSDIPLHRFNQPIY